MLAYDIRQATSSTWKLKITTCLYTFGNLLKWPPGKAIPFYLFPPGKWPPLLTSDKQPTAWHCRSFQLWVLFEPTELAISFCTFALFSLSPFLPFFAPATQASIYWANRQEAGVECEPHRTGKRHFSAPCPIVSVPHPSLRFMLTFACQKNYAKQ